MTGLKPELPTRPPNAPQQRSSSTPLSPPSELGLESLL